MSPPQRWVPDPAAPDRRPRVLAVVLNWNQAEMTIKCLERVKRQEYPCDVMMIDNGSRDDTVSRVAEAFDHIRIEALPANVGFAAGMNVGLRIALAEKFDLVWLLNNDAYADADCLGKLVDALMDDGNLVTVGPKLVYEDGGQQASGARLRWTDGSFEVLDHEQLALADDDQRYLVGAAPVIRVDALRKTGLFAPEFFAYMEDADLGMRLNRVGRLGVVPDAVVVHDIGRTSGGHTSPLTQYLMFRNMWLCLSRNAPAGPWMARWFRYNASALSCAERYEVSGLPAVGRAVLAGVGAARAGRYGPPPESAIDCRWLESVLVAHPTRYRKLFQMAATLAEHAWAFKQSLPSWLRFRRRQRIASGTAIQE